MEVTGYVGVGQRFTLRSFWFQAISVFTRVLRLTLLLSIRIWELMEKFRVRYKPRRIDQEMNLSETSTEKTALTKIYFLPSFFSSFLPFLFSFFLSSFFNHRSLFLTCFFPQRANLVSLGRGTNDLKYPAVTRWHFRCFFAIGKVGPALVFWHLKGFLVWDTPPSCGWLFQSPFGFCMAVSKEVLSCVHHFSPLHRLCVPWLFDWKD